MNMLKNLQQQNFHDIVKKMHSVSGWEMLESDNFLALKSPAKVPFINFVWAEANAKNHIKAEAFFGIHSFAWLLTAEQDDDYLVSVGFHEPENSPEMVIELANYHSVELSSKIKIIVADAEQDFQCWARVASETFGPTPAEISEFFLPLVQHAGCIPYLAFYDGEPAATSLAFCGEKVAGIYAMNTHSQFRCKGLGGAVAQACLVNAKNNGCDFAVLYASEVGKLLYEAMGFQTAQVLKEYGSKK